MLEKEYSKKQILNYTNSYLGNVRTVSVSSTVVTFYKLCQEHMNHRLYVCMTFVLITTLISFLLEMLWVQSQLTHGQYY